MATWTKVVTESSAGNIGQNAATATALASAGTIASSGDVVWTVDFSGANVTAAAAIQANSVDGTHIALGSDAAGDVMYYNGTNYVRLAKGTDGEVLKLASGVPSWASDTNSDTIDMGDGFTVAATTTGTGTTITEGDSLTIAAGTGITTTGTSDGVVTIASTVTDTNTMGSGFTVNATTNTTPSTITESDTLLIAAGTGITTTASADGTVTIASTVTDTNTTTTADVKTALAADLGGAMTIGDANDTVTFGEDVVVTGDLTVSGATTTINTATLQVEDKLIKLADVTTPTVTTADGAGIQVEASGTEADWPEIKWAKAKGGGNTAGSGTADGLTGWTVSNMQTSNQVDVPIAVMDFKSTTGAPSNIAGGIGSFSYNSNDSELYIRTL